MNKPNPNKSLKLPERKINNLRWVAYDHCRIRLRQRYDIRLNLDVWLHIHNKYWLKEYEHKILDPKHDPSVELVFLPAYGTKLIGLFDIRTLVFHTFLPRSKGIFGSVEWKHGNIISYGD